MTDIEETNETEAPENLGAETSEDLGTTITDHFHVFW